MNEFSKYEPVSVIDTQSPFYRWRGTIEEIVEGENGFVRYVVKCTYLGSSLYGVLLLTFMDHQLESNL